VDAFLNGMPTASNYAFMEGMKNAGMDTCSMGIHEGVDQCNIVVTHVNHHHDLLRRRNQRRGMSDCHGDSTGGGLVQSMMLLLLRWVTDVGLTGPDNTKAANTCSRTKILYGAALTKREANCSKQQVISKG
jgi:hypothetical protein